MEVSWDEQQFLRLLRSGLSLHSPLDTPYGRSLLQGEYRRRFECAGCYALSRDGSEYVQTHDVSHDVWVQDVIIVMPDRRILFWKEGSCHELGTPCCLYQSPCGEITLEELFRINTANVAA